MEPFKIISDYLDRAKSRIYGIFIFWVLVIHVPVIFTSIFVDQSLIFQKTQLLKNEYIRQTFYNYSEWWQWPLYVAVVFLVAAILTWLMIWILPKTIVSWAYGRELEDQYEREFSKIQKDGELEDRRQSLADKKLKTATKVENVAKKQDDVEQLGRKQWDKDYKDFENDPAFHGFGEIIKAIYENRGRIKVTQYDDGSGRVYSRIPAEILAIADGMGLIKIDTQQETMELTEKGKYFVSLYPMGR